MLLTKNKPAKNVFMTKLICLVSFSLNQTKIHYKTISTRTTKAQLSKITLNLKTSIKTRKCAMKPSEMTFLPTKKCPNYSINNGDMAETA